MEKVMIFIAERLFEAIVMFGFAILAALVSAIFTTKIPASDILAITAPVLIIGNFAVNSLSTSKEK